MDRVSTWHDIADQLTAEQHELCAYVDAYDMSGVATLRVAREMAGDNLAATVYADVPPPTGWTATGWLVTGSRYVYSPERRVGEVVVCPCAEQHGDGTVTGLGAILYTDDDADELTAERCRELAAVLCEVAVELDSRRCAAR